MTGPPRLRTRCVAADGTKEECTILRPRDLTDSFQRDPRGHSWGTEQVVAHIERTWCPPVTSDQLVGGSPFRFQEDAS